MLENRRLHEQADVKAKLDASLLGVSRSLQTLRRQVLELSRLQVNMLIRGETGSGKELVARCLHDFGPRAGKPFVALNCAAIPEQLFEAELFGHERGAFTGAQGKRIGKLEYADGGTLFLDEIESMPLAQQVKLLRVLQEQRLERLGSNQSIRVDLRIIAATKPDLPVFDMVESISHVFFRIVNMMTRSDYRAVGFVALCRTLDVLMLAIENSILTQPSVCRITRYDAGDRIVTPTPDLDPQQIAQRPFGDGTVARGPPRREP